MKDDEEVASLVSGSGGSNNTDHHHVNRRGMRSDTTDTGNRSSTTAQSSSSSSSSSSYCYYYRVMGVVVAATLLVMMVLLLRTVQRDTRTSMDMGSRSSKQHHAAAASSSSAKTVVVLAPPDFPVPTPNDALPAGFKKPLNQVSETYQRRGKDLTDEQRQALTEQWGSWTLVDDTDQATTTTSSGVKRPRPSWDEWRTLVQAYPNGDVPLNPSVPPAVAANAATANDTATAAAAANSSNSTDTNATTPTITKVTFPGTTLPWQLDTEYLSTWLPHSIALVERAMEAILAEYGHSKFDVPAKSFSERAWMFSINNPADGYNKRHPPSNGGLATPASLLALQKRLLHAVVTQSSFVLAMGGHSAAAAHGNHFVQSYTLQIQRVMEPILARLGVYHVAHNYGMGGMGTVQNALASADLYGDRLDVLLWDCGMTEGEDSVKDLYARTALLTGTTVPVLWGEPDYGRYEGVAPGAGQINTLYYGVGFGGIDYHDDPVKAGEGPFATRYINCGGAANQVCADNRYRTKCWTDFGGITPPSNQIWSPHGAASWHPGHSFQRLTGRVVTFVLLQQLLNGLQKWYKAKDHMLRDEDWHLTADFTRIREAVAAMKDTPCRNLPLSNKVCDVKFHAKSEFTPRYNPVATSIRSIIKEGVFVPQLSPNLYDPPEPHLDVLDPPDGEVDVVSIIENGVDYVPMMARREFLTGYRRPGRLLEEALANSTLKDGNASKPEPTVAVPKRKPITSGLEPGQGWTVSSKSASDNCDGTIDSFCGRSGDNDCLFNGHNDNRGGLGFDSLSGWMIVNLYDVKHGVIIVRIEDWWGPGVIWRTQGWNCENGKNDCVAASPPPPPKNRRALGKNPNQCDSYNFEFAIDGVITSWDHNAFEENRKTVQRVASMWQLLDDPKYIAEGESKDVELAIRLTGCGRATSFGLSHIYWA